MASDAHMLSIAHKALQSPCAAGILSLVIRTALNYARRQAVGSCSGWMQGVLRGDTLSEVSLELVKSTDTVLEEIECDRMSSVYSCLRLAIPR